MIKIMSSYQGDGVEYIHQSKNSLIVIVNVEISSLRKYDDLYYPLAIYI